MADPLLTAAEKAIGLAKKAGAQGCFASMSRFRSVSVEVRDQKLEKVQESTDSSLSIELYVDGRYSSHSSNDLRAESLSQFVEEAVALTRALEVDKYRELPNAELFAKAHPDLKLFDPAVESEDVETRLDRAMEVNARVAGKDKVISASATVYGAYGQTGAVSSNGFSGMYSQSSTGLYANATLRGEGDKRPEDGFGMNTRHLANLESPKSIGDEALRRAHLRLGSKKGPTIKTTMVVDRHAAGSLIARLLGPASGYAVQQGRSMWADKIGKQLVSKKLSIMSDPLLEGANGSQPFDGEGIASFKMPVIQRGALENYFVGTYYARKMGIQPTTRSWGNIIVEPGKRDLDGMLRAVKKGVYVTSWLGGNADSTTGDFSFGLRGHLIEGGKIGAPVGEMNVTGNLLSLFNDLREVGSDPWEHSSLRVPTLAFNNVQFSGA